MTGREASAFADAAAVSGYPHTAVQEVPGRLRSLKDHRYH